MMSSAYILGAIDVLVKSGTVSEDYARGVSSVLTNYQEEIDDFVARHPDRVLEDGRLQIQPDESRALIGRSRHWYDNFWKDTGTYWKNRARKWTRRLRADATPPEAFDRELEDSANRSQLEYVRRELSRPGYRIDPEVAAAAQEAYVRDAKRRVEDAKKFMPETERVARGFTDDYHLQYKTPLGTSSLVGGLYQPKHDEEAAVRNKAAFPSPSDPKYRLSAPSYSGNGTRNLYYRPVRSRISE